MEKDITEKEGEMKRKKRMPGIVIDFLELNPNPNPNTIFLPSLAVCVYPEMMMMTIIMMPCLTIHLSFYPVLDSLSSITTKRSAKRNLSLLLFLSLSLFLDILSFLTDNDFLHLFSSPFSALFLTSKSQSRPRSCC